MQNLVLDGLWEIVERPLADGCEAMAAVAASPASLAGQVPGDVSDSLVAAGRLPEPLVGMNFQQFGWVEERSWWFRRRFELPADWQEAPVVELSLDGLDVHADMWLNGHFLGHHATAFRPFVQEVQTLLRADADNLLLVRLTTGRERVPEHPDFPLLAAVPTEGSRGFPERGFPKRIYLRKPAYTWGWDWGPHLATCGITGTVELRRHQVVEIGNVDLRTRLDGAEAMVGATVELLHHTLTASAWADLTVELTDADGQAWATTVASVFVPSGLACVDLEVRIPQARLWWPNGSGEQHLYTVRVTATVGDVVAVKEPFTYGVRTVDMEVKPGRFLFKVNGQELFIKGGNWIPCDSLYGRIPAAKVTRLVEEAATANFNVLRIWGGGRFEMDAFYDACDRLGVLVWQDFMSACAPLPAHEPWFFEEFRAEAEYQVRRLRHRACMLLWCGNNEVGGCYGWFKDAFSQARDPGWRLYHELLPRLLRDLCPQVPYWPTSPYGGANNVNDPLVGDDHHWVVMSPDSKFWSNPEYWDEPERPIFNSEYGYGGPCCLESTCDYLGFEPTELTGEVARQHTNTFYDIPRVNFSIAEHYRDPANLPLADYILLGGLCQGLNLGYSLESLRANRQSMGGIFWMYDDTWGENGWTIIDYYLRRKVSYYNVKRCLAPQRLVWRRGAQAYGGRADELLLIGLNDGPAPLTATLRVGYLAYDGGNADLPTIEVILPPHSRQTLAAWPLPAAGKLVVGTVVAWPVAADGPLEPVVWRHCRHRDAKLPAASVRVVEAQLIGEDLRVTVASDCYAHAVHLAIGGDYRLSDHFFDLLPGESRTITIYQGAGLAGSGLNATCVNAAPTTVR